MFRQIRSQTRGCSPQVSLRGASLLEGRVQHGPHRQRAGVHRPPGHQSERPKGFGQLLQVSSKVISSENELPLLTLNAKSND